MVSVYSNGCQEHQRELFLGYWCNRNYSSSGKWNTSLLYNWAVWVKQNAIHGSHLWIKFWPVDIYYKGLNLVLQRSSDWSNPKPDFNVFRVHILFSLLSGRLYIFIEVLLFYWADIKKTLEALCCLFSLDAFTFSLGEVPWGALLFILCRPFLILNADWISGWQGVWLWIIPLESAKCFLVLIKGKLKWGDREEHYTFVIIYTW